MLAHSFRWFRCVVLGAVLPMSMSAQQKALGGDHASASVVTPAAAPGTRFSGDSAAPSGPRAVPAGIQKAAQPNVLGGSEPQKKEPHLGAGSNVALMAVGGAAVVLGLLIGGDGGTILALGGGVIGLVGLYRYLQ